MGTGRARWISQHRNWAGENTGELFDLSQVLAVHNLLTHVRKLVKEGVRISLEHGKYLFPAHTEWRERERGGRSKTHKLIRNIYLCNVMTALLWPIIGFTISQFGQEVFMPLTRTHYTRV